jgi:glycosyltransferase involved in cell wall biosynthesis
VSATPERLLLLAPELEGVRSHIADLSRRFHLDLLLARAPAQPVPPGVGLFVLPADPAGDPWECLGRVPELLERTYRASIAVGVLSHPGLSLAAALVESRCRVLQPLDFREDGLTVEERNLAAYCRKRSQRILSEGIPFSDAWLDPPPVSAAVEGPRVSVLIPTYRQAPVLWRAIASALAQDYPHLEVVVADDASPDDTARAVRPWLRDQNCRYVRNATNLGRVRNYHHALVNLASGDWALMLDGDDYLVDPGFLRKALELLRANPRAVFLQAGHRTHYMDGSPSIDRVPAIEDAAATLGGGDYLRFAFAHNFFSHLGTLYDRRRALAIGFYDKDLLSADMESVMRLALEGEVILMRSIAGYWVQHGANRSSHPRLDELGANVAFYRQISRDAARRGLIPWDQLEPALSRFERATLLYQFLGSVRQRPHTRLSVVRFIYISLSTNFWQVLSREFWSACRACWQALGATPA